MIFYEDFIKKVKEAKFELQEVENFSPEVKKMVSGLGVGIPLIIVSLFQLYMAKLDGSIVRVGFGLIFLYIGFKQIKTTLSYKIKVDTKNKKLTVTTMELDLTQVESCTLREGKIGKKLESLIDIITTDKRQFIIPLYMNKKVRFVYSLKYLLGEKFIINK